MDAPQQPQMTQGKPSITLDGKVYVWDETLDTSAIALRKTNERVQKAVNIFALITTAAFTIFFLVSALFFVDIGDLFTSAFWARPSGTGLYFSLAVFFGCFSYFRFTETARQKVKMPMRQGDDPLPQIAPMGPGKTVNIGEVFHPSARKALDEAHALGMRFNHAQLEPMHLVIGAMATDELPVLFARLGIEFKQMKEAITRRLQTRQVGGPPVLSAEAEHVIVASFLNAYTQGRTSIHAIELFYEAYKQAPFMKELFLELNVTEEQLLNVVEWLRINSRLKERYAEHRRAAQLRPTGPMNRSMTSVATPNLDAVSEDLTAAAVRGALPMLIGRDREMEELLRVIEGGRQSVVLVGPEGVGKTAIIAGIAERMVAERVPKVLQDKRLVRLSLTHLISGVGGAKAQERLLVVLNDVAKARNIILVISDIDQLVTNSQGADLASILVDFLQRGSTFAIATTTPQNYSSVIERSLLGRTFQKVTADEPDEQTAIHVLESRIGSIEYEHKVIFSYDAVEKAVKLSDRYMHESYLPEKAINICRETALQVAKTKGQNAFVTGEDVAAIVSQKTNIPVTQVGQDEKAKLLNLEEQMHGRVIGQAEAVKAVASALRRARAELRSEDRPIATFLFMGPTGVGKTELAKTVAETYFGNEANMLRFDMSEYQDKASVYRLIGMPGSTEGGLMTEAVRKQPFSIVLLDELEKAHPDILNLFLQVFDDGRLTDSAGRTVDFTNAIIIATSNAGALYIQDAVKRGDDLESIKTHLIEEELRKLYRPEFLNRFDGIIVFKPLSLDEVEQIAYLMVDKVGSRLDEKGIEFRATDEAVKELAAKGYDPKFGARPLRRVVQETVDNAIANALLEGQVKRRDTIVLKPGGQIEIEKGAEL